MGAVRADGRPVPLVDHETLDLTGCSGKVAVEASVHRTKP
jgi:hypothetical protein